MVTLDDLYKYGAFGYTPPNFQQNISHMNGMYQNAAYMAHQFANNINYPHDDPYAMYQNNTCDMDENNIIDTTMRIIDK